MNKSNTPRRRGSLRRATENSAVISGLTRLSDKLYDSSAESLAGTLMTAETDPDRRVHESLLYSLFRFGTLRLKFIIPLKKLLSRASDQSIILNLIRTSARGLLDYSLKTYGIFSFSYGMYTLIAYLIMRYALNIEIDSFNMFVGLAGMAISMPMMFTSGSLADAINESCILSALFFGLLGIRREYLPPSEVGLNRSNIAFIIGMLFGLLTAFVNPLLLPAAVAVLVFAATVGAFPESGMIIMFGLLPFLPTMYLAVINIYTFLSYFVKLACGRRTLKTEPTDYAVGAFAVLILTGGLFSASPSASIRPALLMVCFILGYFLVINLIKTIAMAKRCLYTLVASAAAVSALGVYEYFGGPLQLNWLDTSMFGDIRGRVVSTFANPNMLGEYLIIIIPFCYAALINARKLSSRITAAVITLTLFGCLVLTWSRGAWLGFLFGTVIFLLMYSRKNLVRMMFALLAIPFLPAVLPTQIISRFLSIGNLSDSSTAYRLNVWKGSLKMAEEFFVSGIGVGLDNFAGIYPSYALGAIESAPHSHSLYLQLLIELGIFGLLIFTAVILLFSRSFLSGQVDRNINDRAPCIWSAAGFASVCAVLLQGMTDYVWYNYRLFFLFWLILGLTGAVIRCTRNEQTKITVDGPWCGISLQPRKKSIKRKAR